MKKFRCVPLREELVILTGDYKKAIVLGQMMYWSERVRDAKEYREEEKDRTNLTEAGVHGWFYKKAEELSEETLMGIKPKSMRTHLKALVESGWLHERRNPHDKMDHTLQYRVNLVQIHQNLQELGCSFSWYSFSHELTSTSHNGAPKVNKDQSEPQKEAPEKNNNAPREGQKETPSSLETIATQGFHASDLSSKITRTKITGTEITQQQHASVVVRDLVQELFGVLLSDKNLLMLMQLATEKSILLDDVIRNTYEYHTKVQPCGNLVGALRYAIQHGG